MWTGVCAASRNVERCAMWNEVDVWADTAQYLVVEVVLCEMWEVVGCRKWWCTDLWCGML